MTTDIESRARALAEQAHAGQLYGDLPYRAHLLAVVTTLRRFGITDPNILAAGWLHDVIEDTHVTIDDLRCGFPAEVADLVWACTDGEGKNRRARKAAAYAKIRGTINAVVVKLADRIANVEACVRWAQWERFRMYEREQRLEPPFAIYDRAKWEGSFRGALQDAPNTIDVAPMWKHLQGVFDRYARRAGCDRALARQLTLDPDKK